MILVDTGAWLALADRGDAYHVRSREFFRGKKLDSVSRNQYRKLLN